MPPANEPPPDDWAAFAKQLGVRLHQLRSAAGMSQETLAHLSGVTRNHYQLIENGIAQGQPANPSLRLVVRLAIALDVDPADLLPDHRHLRERS